MRPRLLLAVASAAVVVAAGGGIEASHALSSSTLSSSKLASVVTAATDTSAPGTLMLTGARAVQVGKGIALVRGGQGLAGGGSRLTGGWITLRVAGKVSEIPTVALPYLGHGLDPSMFDVRALAKTETNGTLPVRITYSGQLPKLPGITITHTSARQAQGYLTAASAVTFGAELARQFAADHARGSYGNDGMFASASIALAGAASLPVVQPRYPMHTLTVNGTNSAGKPDTGDQVAVFNVTNPGAFLSPPSSFYNGTAKYSLPDGTYWGIGLFSDPAGAIRVDVLPEFRVSGDDTVSMDAREANSKVTFSTPRPSVQVMAEATVLRTFGGTVPSELDIANFGTPLYLSPTASPPATGGLQDYTSGQLVAPKGSTAYQYFAAMRAPKGIIADQHWAVTSKNIATLHARFFSAVRTTGMWMFGGQYVDPQGLLGEGEPVPVPGQQTDYLAENGTAYWFGASWQDATNNPLGSQYQTPVPYRPGQQVTMDFNAYPLHTAPNVNLAGAAAPMLASASRAGNTLRLNFARFSDNTRGHLGSEMMEAAKVTGTYSIWQNQHRVASGKALNNDHYYGFFTRAALGAKPSTIKFTLTGKRTGKPFQLSTATTTTWTWRSAQETGHRVPAGWVCTLDGARNCRIEPLLTLGYQVVGLDLTGRAPAGRQQVRLTVGHLQASAASRIAGVRVAFSLNGGKTWRNAKVIGSRAVFSAPAGVAITLRARAWDRAGGTITETITRAYATRAAAAHTATATAATSMTSAIPAGYRAACPVARPGHARCFAVISPAARTAAAVRTPPGLSPQDIQRAYHLLHAESLKPHRTVAIVDAYDTPKLVSYMNTYRSQYHLAACHGCLTKLNQKGSTKPLAPNGTNSGWDVETTLDVDMVSAVCPTCHILVVEANSDSAVDLAAAENTAAKHASVISNSYGIGEFGFVMDKLSASYTHPHHAIVASSGDYGFTQASFPANLSAVTAVGGTTLSKAKNKRGWTERVWNGSGSGCSAYVAKPAWQHDSHCSMRTVADASAVAWNLAIYNKDAGGWFTVGGTSASAPIIAGVYALAGNAASVTPASLYAHAGQLFDITAGSNGANGGAACGYDYLCVAKNGYDAPTGLGTPNGTSAF